MKAFHVLYKPIEQFLPRTNFPNKFVSNATKILISTLFDSRIIFGMSGESNLPVVQENEYIKIYSSKNNVLVYSLLATGDG